MEKLNHTDIKVNGGKFYLFFKRLFDIVASFVAIVILSPILLILAILVKSTSKGPILFKDVRVGRQGKIIKVLKFRSMYVDAETNIRSYLSDEEYQRWLVERKIDNDPRITKIGKFIRKTSLDELPQLFNIFIGDMSIVGSRPITQLELEENFNEKEKVIILSSRPGLTGYWQVYGRSDVDYASGERQRLEMEYYKNRSIFFDFKLMFLTIPAVLSHKGAQ
ncbi:MAG: sugar transferase [Bacilli bacterium]|nr:sugar transferase [Bacilli bacterium]